MSNRNVPIKHFNRPEWHYLETDGTHIDIVIDREVFLKMVAELKSDAPIIVSSPALKLGSTFVMPKENANWGFGERLIFIDNSQNWLRYRIHLVKIIGDPNRSKIATEIQCSLNLIFTLLYLFGNESKRNTQQIGEIQGFSTVEEFGHSAFAAMFSPLATKLFFANPKKVLADIRPAMKDAYEIMYPLDRINDSYSLRVSSDNGYPLFVVPGNCACLGVSCPPSQPDLDDGFEMSPHNFDTVLQQLTMLVGIAKLWQNLRTQTAPQ